MVPDLKEYDYLISTLKQLGYELKTSYGWSRKGEIFVFDLFRGQWIHTTELLESPLKKGRNIPLIELSKIYVGILNYEDLIASKLMRGSGVDFEDCLLLVKTKKEKINIPQLRDHFYELASYDVNPDRIRGHWDSFEKKLRKEGLYDG
ncbi:MAG: hypothetical protein A3D10_00565 [Omnitrophica WOR_2 bacterium RIFCSPHIGHO2_02_FULL_48_11]|nr:MAG: hypothetical protein A3D10_00565 [Omnitrophica WOR_2 bacterium RIFCSPHIGHO2_02_FULL_48_11]